MKLPLKLLIIFTLLQIPAVNALALTGTVLDTEGKPIEGAKITLIDIFPPNESFEVLTSSDGHYKMDFTIGVDTHEPQTLTLGQNFPNPFNPTTTIPFMLESSALVKLEIYNILGQKIRTLVDNTMPEGAHRAVWDGVDDSGNAVSAGVFIYRLRAGKSVMTKKMLLLDGGLPQAGLQSVATSLTAAKTTSDSRNYQYFKVSVKKDDFIPFALPIIKLADYETLDCTLKGVFQRSGFLPGAVFREYKWNGPWRNGGNWQRVTEAEPTYAGAKVFLPNPINKLTVDDLDMAIGAELYIELLQCHASTSGKQVRLNENAWIDIPEAEAIPGGTPQNYQTMTYPAVQIPLDHLAEGLNKFEMTNSGATRYLVGWGQFIFYGVTMRIYYSDDKPHPGGIVSAPLDDSSTGENPTVSANITGEAIKQVDFIGMYDDFNYEGDNIWRQWHYAYHYGKIKHHIGTATEPPYEVEWDTEWLPDQDKPMKIMARIVDESGLCYLTPAVDNIMFEREGRSVVLYKPYDVPEKWVSRASTRKGSKFDITEDLGNAVEARMILVSWAGTYAEEIGINGTKIVGPTGNYYDLSYSIIKLPVEHLIEGVNKPYTYSRTSGHGIEVNWPGIVVKVVYED